MEWLQLEDVEEEINVYSAHIDYLQRYLSDITVRTGVSFYVCFRKPTPCYLHLHGAILGIPKEGGGEFWKSSVSVQRP